VTAALGELETYAQARRRRGQEWVTTGNFAAARFDHLAARPSRTGSEKGYAPDPQLHTHVVIANLTQRPDGAWRSLEPLELYRSQSWATALYRSNLGERVGQLGYGIEISGRRGEWELAGYTRDQIIEFSNRRQIAGDDPLLAVPAACLRVSLELAERRGHRIAVGCD